MEPDGPGSNPLSIAFRHHNFSNNAKDKEKSYDLGMAGYTFVKFPMDDALRMTQRVGIHYFCIKDFHLPMNSTDKEIVDFHKKCKAHDIEG